MLVDEAWYLMRYETRPKFSRVLSKELASITSVFPLFPKCERLGSAYGKAIITNSALKMLLKQSSAAINQISEVFFLSQGEKQLLLSAGVGEGIFFAGMNHVAIRIIASQTSMPWPVLSPPKLLLAKKKLLLKSLQKKILTSQKNLIPTLPSLRAKRGNLRQSKKIFKS